MGRGDLRFHGLFLGWDGSWSGAPVPIGAYAYRISVRDAITQVRHILQGSVRVVRFGNATTS